MLATFGLISGGTLSYGGSPVVHHVSVGGPDFCESEGFSTGCDANFSLVANQYADGTVKGQWVDIFGDSSGGDGIHVDVDCLYIVGNGAVISGVIKKGMYFGSDVTGQRATTAVVDKGTSANDEADQISYSHLFPSTVTCHQLVPTNFDLLPMEHGQVKVR